MSPSTAISSTSKKKAPSFRKIVLNNHDNRRAVTGLPIRDLLIASHILPWHSHENERLNVRNGIALNRLLDAAFDRHISQYFPRCSIDMFSEIVSCGINR